MPANARIDSATLRRDLIDFALAYPQAPLEVLERARELVAVLDEYGPLHEPAEEPAPAPARRVQLGVDQNGGVVARTPEAEPVARTLKTILDLLAKKPLGSMAQLALEFAAHIEALELEAEDLRRALRGAGG